LLAMLLTYKDRQQAGSYTVCCATARRLDGRGISYRGMCCLLLL